MIYIIIFIPVGSAAAPERHMSSHRAVLAKSKGLEGDVISKL